jgi:UDP-N-acetylglucosamine--dolichyl-phosphate N-acetylglucosaminephosphotransferase
MSSLLLSLMGALALCFTVSYLTVPYFNRFIRSIGLVTTDELKREKPNVVDVGGPGVVSGFLLGIFLFIGLIVSPLDQDELTNILASLCATLIITLTGIFHKLTPLTEKNDALEESEQHGRTGSLGSLFFLSPLIAAVPLVVVKAGVSKVTLPFIGRIDLGVLYPLVVVPLTILFFSNATDLLAGFNGLEAGMGFVLHLSIGAFAYVSGETGAAFLALCFAFSLLAFLRYNWSPASVLPGDLRYTIGAVYGCVTVIGNMEKFALICFTPYIIEFLLRAVSRFEAESVFLRDDGVVKPCGDKVRGLTSMVTRVGDYTEPQVTSILVGFEAFICAISFLVINYI